MTRIIFLMLGVSSILHAESAKPRKEMASSKKRTAGIEKALLKQDPSIQPNHNNLKDSRKLDDSSSKKLTKSSLTQLNIEDLSGVQQLSPKRREIISWALKLGRENPNNHYLFGSADFKRGGVDCSGAMYLILRKLGISAPRTSATQYDWVQKNDGFVKVSEKVTSLDDPAFETLKPGDLLFWSHTYNAKDGRKNGITHVQMYLGKEKKDGRRVMIGSSDGRSYRGKRQDGYAVFDFKLPHLGSKQKFVGFGSPLSGN